MVSYARVVALLYVMLLLGMMADKIKLQNELFVATKAMSQDAPTVQTLHARAEFADALADVRDAMDTLIDAMRSGAEDVPLPAAVVRAAKRAGLRRESSRSTRLCRVPSAPSGSIAVQRAPSGSPRRRSARPR